MDSMEKGLPISNITLITMFIIMLLLISCIVCFAIQDTEARPFIGKEIEIGVVINLKNDVRHVELCGVLLNVINGKEFLYNVDLLTVSEAGYYLVLDTEYQSDPLLVPCKSVTYIRRRTF
jgi:hypothetical protein